MDTSQELSRWVERLKRTLSIIPEGRQRFVLLVKRITALPPEEAAEVFLLLVRAGLKVRDRPSKLALEALMRVLAEDQWPREHLSETRASAQANEYTLVSNLLDLDWTNGTAAEDDSFPVPNYTGGRPLTLGERRSLASRPDRRLLEMAVRDPHPMVIAKLLDNPRLTEKDVMFIATRRPAPAEVLTELGTHPKWRLRRRVALALCLNPHTPVRISITLLLSLPVEDIVSVAENERLYARLRIAAMAVLDQL